MLGAGGSGSGCSSPSTLPAGCARPSLQGPPHSQPGSAIYAVTAVQNHHLFCLASVVVSHSLALSAASTMISIGNRCRSRSDLALNRALASVVVPHMWETKPSMIASDENSSVGESWIPGYAHQLTPDGQMQALLSAVHSHSADYKSAADISRERPRRCGMMLAAAAPPSPRSQRTAECRGSQASPARGASRARRGASWRSRRQSPAGSASAPSRGRARAPLVGRRPGLAERGTPGQPSRGKSRTG